MKIHSIFAACYQRWIRIAIALCLVVFSGIAVCATPLTSDSLVRLHEHGAAVMPPFSFAIVGETRDALPYRSSPVFQQIIRQVNVQRANFMVLLGDVIDGGDNVAAPRQWNEFEHTIRTATAPLVCAPGEHDIWNKTSAQVWAERIGPCWYSFDYSESHFIILDSEADPRHWITGDQLTWLRKDLEAAKRSKNIFVFLHRSLFADPATNWDTVHGMLMGYPVKAVFGSHLSRYEMMPTRQGIQYYSTGGGGAEMSDPPELGGFPHFMVVTVFNSQVKVEVMRPSGDRIVASAIRSTQRKAVTEARQNVKVTNLIALLGKDLSTDGSVVITNTTPIATLGDIEWSLPNRGWSVTPKTARYEAAPNRQSKCDFRMTATPEALMGPLPSVSVGYSLAYIDQPMYITGTLPLVRRMQIVKAVTPITVDGSLEDWGVTASMPLSNVMGTKPTDESECAAKVRFAWAKGWLYVAVEVKDDTATFLDSKSESQTNIDNVRLLFAPMDTGRSQQTTSVLEYLGCQAVDGPRIFKLRMPENTGGSIPASDVQFGTSRKNGVTRYEFGLRAAALAPLSLTSGESFSLNLFVSDDDGPRTPEEFTMLSFIGGGLPVGTSWPRVTAVLSE
jgi:hypothetical protein